MQQKVGNSYGYDNISVILNECRNSDIIAMGDEQYTEGKERREMNKEHDTYLQDHESLSKNDGNFDVVGSTTTVVGGG